MKGRVLAVAAALLAALGVLAFVLIRGGDEPPPTTTTTTTSTTTTAVPPPSGTPAPLTGLPVSDEDLHLIGRAALGVKIDNDPRALPQWGLGQADIVVELRVEGISRFLAVFHSRDVAEVGPVRSARTSDPDLYALFGRPLGAWSGANAGTLSAMRSSDWIQDVSFDRLSDAYRRDRRTGAPHNLVLDARAAFGAADDPVPPTPLFRYRDAQEPPAGTPLAGAVVMVGLSRSEYVWDADRGGWLRWSDGRLLHDAEEPLDEGEEPTQLAPANVVVLETEYVRSEADSRSPEAVSVGEGRAWVLTGGHLVEGTWQRDDRQAPWTLTAGDGSVIGLTPGTTWVALVSTGADPVALSGTEAAARRAG